MNISIHFDRRIAKPHRTNLKAGGRFTIEATTQHTEPILNRFMKKGWAGLTLGHIKRGETENWTSSSLH